MAWQSVLGASAVTAKGERAAASGRLRRRDCGQKARDQASKKKT